VPSGNINISSPLFNALTTLLIASLSAELGLIAMFLTNFVPIRVTGSLDNFFPAIKYGLLFSLSILSNLTCALI